jgi:MoaA/NifB/PqqE/SkfB family radical SAM enzyme
MFGAVQLLQLGGTVARSHALRAVGRVPLPSVVIYLTTHRCNLACPMCSTVTYPTDDEMDTATACRVLSELGKPRIVRLSGGEPFLRTDLVALVRHVQATCRPQVVHITTNGTLRAPVLDLVRDRRGTAISIAVSLDGLGATHDRIRGPGTFERTFGTLQRLAAVRASYGFRLEVNCTLHGETLSEVPRIDAEMRRLGVSVSWLLARDFHPAMPPPTHPDHPPCPIYPPLLGNFDQGQLAAALDSILSGRIHGYSSSERLARRYYIEGIRNRLVRGRRAPDPPCVALTDHVRLMPNGEVTVCRSDLSVVGNAARSGFRAVWFGPEAARLRQVVRQCKRCWYTCEAIPNGIFSGDLLRWYVTSASR